jgi:hypothetical protein
MSLPREWRNMTHAEQEEIAIREQGILFGQLGSFGKYNSV